MSPRPKLTDLRRQQILEAAAAVIAERGLADARIADIADRIGVSPALILYYFESKDVLLGEALAHKDRQFFESVTAAMAEAESPGRRLATLIEASCPTRTAGLGVDDEYVLWIEVWSRSRHDTTLAKSRREMDGRWRGAIADVVRHGQDVGEFGVAVDPDDFALRLAALIDGLAIQVVLGDDHVGPDDMRRLCLAAAATELGVPLISE
ncbi:MAG TPA: TetR family transcriptional regulator C-terminal domain-containing protein [Acidimicrobiia bacterium]|nr:TetR family transcriptional regulator C-terminal domain-containing protein [Acidimicrobiia bacterium]